MLDRAQPVNASMGQRTTRCQIAYLVALRSGRLYDGSCVCLCFEVHRYFCFARKCPLSVTE